MGVAYIWQLLEPAGEPVTLESLEGLRLAVDVSLWIHQATRSRAADGQKNAHLSVLFHRLCKLLFHRIRPVFVFDGQHTPFYKQQTLTNRRFKRDVASAALSQVQRRLLARMALKADREQNKRSEEPSTSAVQDARPANNGATEPKLNEEVGMETERMFSLPGAESGLTSVLVDDELIPSSDDGGNSNLDEEIEADTSFSSSQGEINVEAEEFKALSPRQQREMLVSAKEARYGRRSNVALLPEKADDFSKFQFCRLINKQKMDSKLDQLNKHLISDGGFETTTGGVIGDVDTVKIVVHEGHKRQHVVLEEQQPSEVICIDDSSESPATITVGTSEFPAESAPISVRDNEPINIRGWLSDKKLEFLSNERLYKATATPPAVATCSSGTVCEQETVTLDSPPLKSRKKSGDTAVCSVEYDRNTPFVTRETTVTDVGMSNEETESDFEDVPEYSAAFDDYGSRRVTVNSFVDHGDDLQPDSVHEHILTENDKVTSDVSAGILKATEQPSIHDGTLDELTRMQHSLQAREREIGNTVYEDCQELLRLFGVPYLTAPGEAEAQCAQLENQGLVNATVGEDSDSWLFGGRCLYRHLFQRDKYVQKYTAEAIKAKLGLDRDQMILMGMLTGCDYTRGVLNVGLVTAVEILSEFGDKKDPLETLISFRDWYTAARKSDHPANERSRLKRRLRGVDVVFPDGFPDSGVFRAYRHPRVEVSDERFAWDSIDLEGVVHFCLKRLNWPETRTRQLLQPVVERWNPLMNRHDGVGVSLQTRITNFTTRLSKEEIDGRLTRSRRVLTAVEKLKNPSEAQRSPPSDNEDTKQRIPSAPSPTPLSRTERALRREAGRNTVAASASSKDAMDATLSVLGTRKKKPAHKRSDNVPVRKSKRQLAAVNKRRQLKRAEDDDKFTISEASDSD